MDFQKLGHASALVTNTSSASLYPLRQKQIHPQTGSSTSLFTTILKCGKPSLRKTTVEPFQGRLKSLFELKYLCMKGLANVRTLVILATLAYLLLALLNYRLGRDIKLQDTLIAIR